MKEEYLNSESENNTNLHHKKSKKNELAAIVLGIGMTATLVGCTTLEGTVFALGLLGGLLSTTSLLNYNDGFFTCNQWVDKNYNGGTEMNEFEGIKKNFRPNEPITVVATFSNQSVKGSLFNMKLFNYAGREVYSEGNYILPFEYCAPKTKFNPWELFNLGGAGEYQAHFYLNNILVGVESFSIDN